MVNVIVGLGNPGQTYHGTRHNVGFAVIQALAERHQVSLQQRILTTDEGRPAAVAGEYRDGKAVVRLMMPLTMMNESGVALNAAQIPASELLIVCDDVNLPVGVVRLRSEGGAGGHHGLQSCLEALATERVARLRIGVGSDPLPSDLREFVLSPFLSAERPMITRAIAQAMEACDTWVREGIGAAMNQYNRVPEPS